VNGMLVNEMDTLPQSSGSAVKPPRQRSRRLPIRDDRLPNAADMRTRSARRFTTIIAAVRREFGNDADAQRVGELARLRMINEDVQAKYLAGKANEDAVVRVANLVARKERELALTCRAKSSASAGHLTFADLASLARESIEEPEPDAVEDIEPEGEAE
jgi:hypothetical protein